MACVGLDGEVLVVAWLCIDGPDVVCSLRWGLPGWKLCVGDPGACVLVEVGVV